MNRAIREYTRNLKSTVNPIPIVFEDPLYSQPLLKVPIEWVSIRGEYDIRAELDGGEPVVRIEYSAATPKNNAIRIGFNTFPDMQRFLNSVQAYEELTIKDSKFEINQINRNALYKKEKRFADVIAISLAIGSVFGYLFSKLKIKTKRA